MGQVRAQGLRAGHMMLGGILVAFVTEGATWAHEAAEVLRSEGASVRECAPDRDLWLALASEPFDAIALADPGEVRGLLRALGEEPRTRDLPTLLLRPEGAAPLPAAPTGALVIQGPDLALQARDAIARHRRRGRPAAATGPSREKLGTVAHDVRVLLGIVVGFAANLRDAIAGPVNDGQREHARKIVEAATDASALVEQLLTSEGPEVSAAARPPLRVVQRTNLDLAQIVTGVMLLFEGHAADRGVEIVREGSATPSPPEAPVHVWGDALQLKQVVTNLLVNAIKFTPPGGKVTLSVSLAEGAGGPGPVARRVAALIVSDTGPGIPPEARERIFERGVRLGRDAGLPGSGIGLSVVRDLVARHGGSVAVRESPAGGAEFVVRLPLDLRSRSRDALVVLRDRSSLDRVVRALEGAHRAGTLAASRGDLLAALDQCDAVVVVPQGADLLAAQGDDPERSPR